MALPRVFRRSSMVINMTAIALAGLIIWAAWAEIDQVSRATGQVIPAGRVQLIQSADGGVIGEILVREGDRVRRGQKLVVLDPVRIQAAVEESRAKVASYRTIKSRVEAELFDRPLVFTEDVQSFPEFVANQRQLYSRRRTAQAADIGTLRNMQAIARRELEMNMPLLEFGDVSRSEIMRLQRSVADIEGQIANRQNKYLQDLQAEYSRTEEELVVAEQTLKQRLAALDAAILFAPTDGVVKNVRFTTIGAVLRPGDEVLQIVPTGDKLIIEAKVSPTDIAYLRVGQNASVKFDAYDSSIYGSAEGRVTYISPDTLTEQKPTGEQIFYRVNVTADARSLRPRARENIEIQPGMTATVEIKTGKNTVLGYLLKPISKTFGDSMGER
ncbi:adhesin transport system membrane fusion protein [Sphingopyxis sp. OAS728]|uniref:HlyD family efflux transporter periplasmic adaptor subunit n=1 Tax=Sphingopyxis sp. OAS728 TaxID=2663823 RepID=UPI00178AB239|nr:HlyD family efflux transporter periplasmic adaptor subunit [Sphingopyxis sp. OAS728]MBE1525960.1 adhesin transport system membrane fusion protein [Sphingopyxis sp. OAS728]